jgi:hypothetical protein
VIKITELQDWLRQLQAQAHEDIAIDEGGLTLTTNDGSAYLEVGGWPEEDDGEDTSA